MKNKKGFTLTELLISFSLASVVMVILLNVILILKDLYVEDGLKTQLLINQTNFNRRLEDIMNAYEITEVSSCGETCFNLYLSTGEEKKLYYDSTEHAMTIDTYKVELTSGAKVGAFKATTQTITTMTSTAYDNSVLTIKIPITHKYIDGDYGVNFVYPYNSNYTIIIVS